jgi:hypothetical protein
VFIGGLYAIMEIVSIALGGSNPANQVHGLVNGRAAGHFLMHAVEVWIYYLAIEPYVRRIWPHMLIGLVRGFSGRWRDPAIGREVLIGVVAACILVAALTLLAAAESRLVAGTTTHQAHPLSLRIILSPGDYLSNMAHFVAWAVLAGFSFAGVVVIIRLLVRHPWASVAVAITVIAFLEFRGYYFRSGVGALWSATVYALALGACLVWLITRIGVLAAMVFMFVMIAMGLFGLAFDAWSTPYLASWLAILLALASYGFWVSLAGQPLFKDMLAQPQVTRS